MLKGEPDGEPYLFFGSNSCEIFFVAKDSELLRFQLTFFGNHAEGGLGLKLKIGSIVTDESSAPRMKGSDLIRWDSRPTAAQFLMFNRFIQNVKGLPDFAREQILKILT